jgi:DNA-binding MarR family transcriptional regulator
LSEVRQVLNRLADAQNLPEVKQRLQDRPGRLQTLYELTGGNPRALGLIFELLRQGPNSRAVEDFERLMDITTPYFKARFEDLAEQAQVVVHALAVGRPDGGAGLRFGLTAAEIGTHAGLPTSTVSAQLDPLEREGLVEKSASHGRTQYRMAEQLFRLWLQMRGNRRVRQNVVGLTQFLEAMFSTEELQTGAAPSPKPDSNATPALQALVANQAWTASRGALTQLFTESPDLASALVNEHFIEKFLATVPMHDGQAATVRDILVDLGIARYARPLLLALEATIENRPDMLRELEPEIQNAAQQMYKRITNEISL